MNPKTGYDNLTKVLKNHLAHCKVREFSLQKDRHCTCGVEKAREELEELSSWKEEIEEACIVDWVPMSTPKETLARLISWNIKMVLDPAISKDALNLVAEARMTAFDEAMGVIEAGDDWNTVIRKIFRLANPDLSTGTLDETQESDSPL